MFVKDFLTSNFNTRVISRGFENEWPANSPDLNPLDYRPWNYLKSQIYSSQRPNSFGDLKVSISNALSSTSKDLLSFTIRNIIFRMKCCIDSKEGHFENFM